MLVCQIKTMKDGKQVRTWIPSTAHWKAVGLDEIECFQEMLVYGRRNEQRTSWVGTSGSKSWSRVGCPWGETCRDDKLIREVIQCTSQVVDRVAEDQRELGRDIGT